MGLLKRINYFLGGEPEELLDEGRRPNIKLHMDDFEEWASESGFDLEKGFNGKYKDDETDSAYDGFIAAYLIIKDKIDRGDY